VNQRRDSSPKRPPRSPTLAGLALLALSVGCSPLEDPVFEVVGLALAIEPIRIPEAAGVVSIPVRLTRPTDREVAVSYHALGMTAQNGCQVPDFEAPAGKLVWPAGTSLASLQVWIQDDTLAETDERLKLVFEDAQGILLGAPSELSIEIVDDDRSELIDARASYGVQPNSPLDQSRALQAALDAAAASARGVVVLAAGDYELASVSVHPGTTLSGRLATLHRPAHSAVDVKTLIVEHSGQLDSAPTLIEGVHLDGRRDQQGAFLSYERESANLIDVAGDPALPGRLEISLEDLSLSAGTGDGLEVGTNVDANLCHLQGNDLWRDMLSVRGGNTRVRVRDLDATASSGKTGLWFDGGTPGYSGTHHLDLELEDLRLETGDLELEVSDASQVSVKGLIMTEPPFRLVALGSFVTIADSVITAGIRAPSNNYWGPFQDVAIKDSTLRISENDDTGTEPTATETVEADRVLSPMLIQWTLAGTTDVPAGNLSIDNCRFDQPSNAEPTDTLYAVNSKGPGPTIRITGSVLPPSFKSWFAPGCVDCLATP
jgi:Calx-beta domain